MVEHITIIGAGVMGVLIATRLAAERPGTAVTLIDRGLVGLGTSAWSAGVSFPVGRTARVRAMAAESLAFYRALAERDPEAPIDEVRALAVCAEPRATELHGIYAGGGAIGRCPDRLRTARDALVAWSVPDCHVADVAGLVACLIRRLRGRVEIVEGVAVTSLSAGPAGVSIMLATGECIDADSAVLAPGPWSNAPAWRELTAPLEIRVKKVVAFHLDAPVGPDDEAILFPDEDAFLAPTPRRGHWLYSYTCPEWDFDVDGISPGLSPANLAEGRALLAGYLPDTASRLRGGRVFCDAYGPAREPIVARLDLAGTLIFAGAANGSGYRLAPAIAREAVELLN